MKTYNTNHFKRKCPEHEDEEDDEATQKDPSCFITMSPIWASLPRELVDKILDSHITNHLPEPHLYHPEWPNNTFYAWLTLRNSFNSAIKRRIEGYYRTYVLTSLHLVLYTWRPDGELDDSARAEMLERHYRVPIQKMEYLGYRTNNQVEPPMSEEEKWASSQQMDWQAVSECDSAEHGGDKLALFRWPGWGPYGTWDVDKYERRQEHERTTAAGLWWSYAAALQSLSDMMRMGGGGETNDAKMPRHNIKVPPEMRRVGVILWNAVQPKDKVSVWINHAYVRPEGFELPGFELGVLEPSEGGEREGAPELCVRFRWREVVTVVLRRLERGLDGEERALAEERIEKMEREERIDRARRAAGWNPLDDIW